MRPNARRQVDLEPLVEHMFAEVMAAEERAELLMWIRRWEAANPDADSADRVTGWIDVAYDFQARNDARQESRRPIRTFDSGGFGQSLRLA